MNYSTSIQLYPGALTDGAAILLKVIYASGTWYPVWIEMKRSEIDAFAELQQTPYIEIAAYFGYRVKGVDPLVALRAQQDMRNRELNKLYSGGDQLIEKYTARYTVIDFRLRPYRSAAVNEAHDQHWRDVQSTLDELRRVG